MGYFSFAFMFTVILGIMCFLLIGCSDTSHKTSLSNIPPTPIYKETVCNIDTQRKALLKEADILKHRTHQVTTEQDTEAKNYPSSHTKY